MRQVRRAFFPDIEGNLVWKVVSFVICTVSFGLIVATLGYRVRGITPPATLSLGLALAFAVAAFVFSKFLFHAYREQRRTEGVLNDTERGFQSVYENTLDAIVILDDQAVCREANPAAEKLFGVRREELIGQAIVHFYKNPEPFQPFWERLSAEKVQQGEAELIRNDHPAFVKFTAKSDCLPGQHVIIFRDVTQRRRAQLSLLESEERFQQMASNIQEVFWMIDAETKNALYVNQAYAEITGRSVESLHEAPSSYEEVIHPEDRQRVLEKRDEATRTGRFDERFRVLRPDREVRWVWARGFPVREANGVIRRLVGTALDVTEAEALRSATLALIQDLHMDSVMDTLLRALAELVPYTCARVFVPEGGPWVQALGERVCPESGMKSHAYLIHLNAEESPFLQRISSEQKSVLIPDTRQEAEWQTFKGHENFRSWLSVPLFASGQYLGFLSVGHVESNQFNVEHLRRAQLLAIPAAAAIQNSQLYAGAEIYAEELEKRIAELHQAKAALIQSESTRTASEERFQKVFRSSPIAFSITTLDEGRFVDVNVAFEARYGYTRSELIGRTVHELGIWEDPADRTLMTAQLRRGPVRSIVTKLRAKSGEIRVTAYSADRIQFDGQQCVLAVSEDVHVFDPHQSN
ncbi:MAG TPA: PAS domain S-box protein [Terriglobales bacterium]|nr:PAS domain S-box protein [Terriglobales bacterium]